MKRAQRRGVAERLAAQSPLRAQRGRTSSRSRSFPRKRDFISNPLSGFPLARECRVETPREPSWRPLRALREAPFSSPRLCASASAKFLTAEPTMSLKIWGRALPSPPPRLAAPRPRSDRPGRRRRSPLETSSIFIRSLTRPPPRPSAPRGRGSSPATRGWRCACCGRWRGGSGRTTQ